MGDPDTLHTHEIVCPHCGYEHPDSWEAQLDAGEYECHECERLFICERYTDVTYSTRKHKEATK